MKSSVSGTPTILSSPKKIKTDFWQESVFVPLLASLAVGLLAVSSDSFWIDEGLSAVKAIAPTPVAVWQELRTEGNTNLHMLLYMFALWAWEKLAGPSEWALRAMNIPFYMLGVAALWGAVPRVMRPCLLAFCLLSPFLWFYLNEARTYSMLFGFSAVATAALVEWLDHGKDPFFAWARWGWILSLSLVALIWTHVVGLVFELAVAILVFTHVGRRGLPALLCKVWAPMMFLAATNLALVGYVLWTKTQGVEANPIGKTNVLGFVYWLYEFGGLSGLGPNRNELRINPFASLRPYFLPLGFLGLAWSAVLLGGWKSLCSSPWRRQAACLAFFLVLIPLLTFLLIGVWQGIRFLPRYAVSSYPAFALLASFFLCAAWTAGGWRRWAGLLWLLALGVSCLNLRFNPAHAKDDYRGVAQWLTARKIPAENIWWAADAAGARFYALENAEVMMSPSLSSLDSLPRPDWIVLSKPDIYDGNGAIRDYLAKQPSEQVASFQSFVLYRVLK